MGFTEITFLFVFMPLSIIIYLVAELIFHNDRVNNVILVVLSLLFYFWADKEALIIFVALVLFTYMAGWMVKPVEDQQKNGRLLVPIVLFTGILSFYKYISLVAAQMNNLIGKELINIDDLIVPIGLSFVIFESISYVVDIYRGDADAGGLLDCLTFLSIFPKLVSGPIVLWKDFRTQLSGRRSSLEKISGGIDRIIIGYAKKSILADTFGIQIAVIDNGIAGSGVDVPTLWLRALLYFFQLYFDFSGYSDIAIGLCRIFGFEIKENFNYPYLSKSISEFWRRWHISLGAWFREYVYIPLGGNRKHVYVNLFIVFLLTGIWHGQGLNYLLWGVINGLFVVMERAVRGKDWYNRIPGIIKWMATIIIVYFLWILFSAGDLSRTFYFYQSMFSVQHDPVNFTWQYYLTNRICLFLMIALAGHILGLDGVRLKLDCLIGAKLKMGGVLKKGLLLGLFVMDIFYVVNSSYSPFMYFQF